ncbi:MAG: metal-sulfur cluster assembly factor [Acidobacteriota bacterium]|nr:metal-sulfur cluster assembly factor [Acidobacteriota bacterium]
MVVEPNPDAGTSAVVPGVLGLLTEPLTAALVRDRLQHVIDPELGVNIVDLGLVYEVEVDEQAGGVAIELTLTTPGCPLSGFMDDSIRGQLAQLPQVRAIAVELVWEPPWSPEMMSSRARQALGWR